MIFDSFSIMPKKCKHTVQTATGGYWKYIFIFPLLALLMAGCNIEDISKDLTRTTSAGTGVVATTVQEKLGRSVSVSDWGGDLKAAITNIGATKTTLIVDMDTALSANLTVPENVTLEKIRAGLISGPFTLTINGGMSGDLTSQWFDTDVTVVFGGRIEFAHIEWWGGGVGGAAAINDTAFKLALASIGNIHFLPGTYSFSAGVVATAPIYLQGAGLSKTILSYTGTEDFIYVDLPKVTRGGGISSLKISAPVDTTYSLIKLSNSWRFPIVDCELNGGGTAIELIDSTYATIINRCVIQSFSITGVNAGTLVTDLKISQCDIGARPASTGWSVITAGSRTVIENSWFEVGPLARPAGAGGHIKQIAGTIASVTISGNSIGSTRANGGHQISIEGGSARIIGNFIAGGQAGSNLLNISAPAPYLIEIVGNEFNGFVDEAIEISAGIVTITGNSFYALAGAFTQDSFIVDTGGSINITGNYFYMNKAAVLAYAVEGVTGGTEWINIFSNNITSNVGGSKGYVAVANGNKINAGSGGANGLKILNGTAVGNYINNCAVGITSANSTVSGNYLSGNVANWACTTSMLSGNVGDNETITTDAKTLQPWGVTSLDTTAGALAGTLGAGQVIGQMKTIVMTVDNGDYRLTVTKHESSDPGIITFAAVGDTAVLMWTGSGWITIRRVIKVAP